MTIRETDPTSILEPPGCRNVTPHLKLRTYGRITKSGSGAPLKIERLAGYIGSVPQYDDVTADFTISLNSITPEREITIAKTTGNWVKGNYRIVYDRTLNEQSEGYGEAELLSVDVDGTPRIASFIHTFATQDTCGQELLMMFDMNNDDDLCTQDVVEWTANPVDFNGDSTICSQDLGMLLLAIDNFHAN